MPFDTPAPESTTTDRASTPLDLEALEAAHAALRAQDLALDLTRGKPSPDQLALSDRLDGILAGAYRHDGTDLRNYDGSYGLSAAKRLGAVRMDVPAEAVLVGGNASLEMMFHAMLVGTHFGWDGPESAWANRPSVKVICPVPGYDRHFTVSQRLGHEMVPVPMLDDGPDMDVVDSIVADDPDVAAMWLVPKHSNPTGAICSDEVVARIAALGNRARRGFRIIWDNAYAVHDLTPDPIPMASLWAACEEAGTTESVIHVASTSKITFAGAGLSFLAAGPDTLTALRQHLSAVTIGPDKVNQQRHVMLLPDIDALRAHMARHAALITPKVDATIAALEEGLTGLARWTTPRGGYFVSLWTPPGLATEVVGLAAEAGVRLTPAGAAFPLGHDPEDSHIRLAPSFPTLEEVRQAMDVVVTCVRLAIARSRAA